jgi:flagellar basal-body rod modification protein FlgD
MSTIANTGFGQTSGELRDNYLLLMIEQLKNQNPMDPVDNDQMVGQLAALAQLEHVEGISTKFEQALFLQQVQQGSSLIGKEVTYLPPQAKSNEEAATGTVDAVRIDGEKVYIDVNNQSIELDKVLQIQ